MSRRVSDLWFLNTQKWMICWQFSSNHSKHAVQLLGLFFFTHLDRLLCLMIFLKWVSRTRQRLRLGWNSFLEWFENIACSNKNFSSTFTTSLCFQHTRIKKTNGTSRKSSKLSVVLTSCTANGWWNVLKSWSRVSPLQVFNDHLETCKNPIVRVGTCLN